VIGGMILLGFFLYWLIAKKVVGMVYTETQSIIKKRIAIAIFVLIPTWDVILGFPIYWYLCATQAGIKIYKTVDNVEGFYVGENHSESSVLLPYEGYRFIDYKEPKNGKYYRNSWLDTNTSTECVSYIGAWNYNYTRAFRSGKCITKEEIKVGDVSRWEYDSSKNIRKVIVPIVKIAKTIVAIKDKQQNKNLAEDISYSMDQNWVIGIIKESISVRGSFAHCSEDKNMLEKVLKTINQEEK